MNDRPRTNRKRNLRQPCRTNLPGLNRSTQIEMPKTIRRRRIRGLSKANGPRWATSNDRECYDALGDEATEFDRPSIPGNKRPMRFVLLVVPTTTPFSHDTGSPTHHPPVARVVVWKSPVASWKNTSRRTHANVAFARENRRYFNLDSWAASNHARESRRRGEHIVAWLCLEMVVLQGFQFRG